MSMSIIKLTGLLDKAGDIFDVHEGTKNLWNEIFHGGKEKYGSLYLKDKNGDGWKIKVRWTGDRKHYIKVKKYPEHTEETNFRAAVGKKHIDKPWKYKELLPEEWKILAVTAVGEEDSHNLPLGPEYMEACSQILNELVYERKLEVKPD